jgi:hypothetical protein
MADRGLSRPDAEQRVNAHPPLEAQIARADLVISTDGSLEETRAQVEAAWRDLLERAKNDEQ